MTEKDKTSDQLAASIAKTKRTAASAKKATVGKAPQRKTTPRKTTPRKTSAGSDKQTATAGVYQYGRRVWPD